MRVLRIVALALGVLLALVLIIAYFLPATFSVQRSTMIAAPADSIYVRFATPRTWARWSAWTTAADPTLVYTYAGPDSGAGATMLWTAERMGKGELRIVEAVPGRAVGYDLRFVGNDMTVHGQVTLEPSDGGTKVTWRDTGSLGKHVLMRYVGPMLDGSLAMAYETSFANLRRETETGLTGPAPSDTTAGPAR